MGYIKSMLRRLWDKKFIIAIILAYIFIVTASGIGCIFHWLTGISCPACGMTRAIICLLRFDITGAFYYHPLFWLIIPSVVYFVLGKQPLFGSKKRQLIISLSIFVIIIAVYIYRLFFVENSPITIDISSSIVVKLFHSLF